MSYCLPVGYQQRTNHEDYLDVPGEFIFQPYVYQLAIKLAERSDAIWIVDIGCGSGEKLAPLVGRFKVVGVDRAEGLEIARQRLPEATLFECDLDQGLPELPEDMLRRSVVICSDVIEHMKHPERLMQSLAKISKITPFLLISTPDRDRARGWLDDGPPANPAHVMEWSATEFVRFMKTAGFTDVPFYGHTINTDFHCAKSTLLTICGTHAEYKQVDKEFRVAAIIHTFNEIDVLPEVVDHLNAQGIEVHVFDNWSEDGTWEMIGAMEASGKIKKAARFPDAPVREYEWHRQLQMTEIYAQRIDADWVIHHDADEIRLSPWKPASLKNALNWVDALGYSAVDFTVLDFRFLVNRDTFPPYERSMTHFEFGTRPGHFTQIKAWKNSGKVDLASSGGHQAQFKDRKVYPLKFLLKHYPLRTCNQATKKIFRDRLPRFGNEKINFGWHTHYDALAGNGEIQGWTRGQLIPYHPILFSSEYLVERVSGIGLIE